MAEPTTIAQKAAGYDISSIKSKLVTAKASAGTINAKAGHLLFWDASAKMYVAYPVETALETKTTRCVVLLQDATLTTSESTAQAIVAGTVYDSFVLESGITSTQIADLSALNSGVTFLNRKEVAINA